MVLSIIESAPQYSGVKSSPEFGHRWSPGHRIICNICYLLEIENPSSACAWLLTAAACNTAPGPGVESEWLLIVPRYSVVTGKLSSGHRLSVWITGICWYRGHMVTTHCNLPHIPRGRNYYWVRQLSWCGVDNDHGIVNLLNLSNILWTSKGCEPRNNLSPPKGCKNCSYYRWGDCPWLISSGIAKE